MTLPKVPQIDWRRQFRALQPHLVDRGGVVCLHVTEGSPASTFSKVIRQVMNNGQWPRPWKSVQLDALNSNTHYLEDVVIQLEYSLELAPESASLVAGGLVQVGVGNEAQSVTISDVEVSYQEDDYVRVHRAHARLDRVARAIEERLETERIAVLLLNSHTYDPKTLARFRRMLWDSRLQRLAESGLLLIDISDPSRCGPDWPPQPNLVLDLPERFDEVSRLDAYADLQNLALSEGIATNADGAEMFANTLLDTSDTIRDIYTGLARMLARKAETR